MRAVAAIFLSLTLIVPPVSAQLVDENEEATPAGVQIGRQFDALMLANTAANNVGRNLDAVPAEGHTFVQQIYAAMTSHMRALLWTLDMNGGASVGQNRAFLLRPREEVLAKGLADLRATSYAQAQATLASMRAACLTCPGLKSATDNLDKAVRYLTEFDYALDYTQPRHAWNLAFPVATREQSSVIAPHGDYRRYGEEINESLHITIDVLKKHFKLAAAHPELLSNKKWSDTTLNLYDTFSKVVRAWQLAVGLEDNSDVAAIDIQEQNDSTNRGRQFFRGMIALELLINTDHLPPYEGDVFGRTDQIRGEPYQWDNACGHYVSIIRGTGPSPMVLGALDIIHQLCNGWESTDNAAANLLHLRYNTSFQVTPGEGHGPAPDPEPAPAPEEPAP